MRVSSYFALFLTVWSIAFADEANFEAAIIDDYVAVSKAQESRLDGATMEVEIAAEMPKLHKSGRLHALRRISALGRITYDALRFEGDHSIKNEVIARYLTAESEALKSEPSATAVTPVNYKFSFKGARQTAGATTYYFSIKPRKKRPGLFKGRVYLDAHNGSLVRVEGSVVKSPSFFVKHIEFWQDYTDVQSFTLPAHIHTVAKARIVGRTIVDIVHRDYQTVPSITARVGLPAHLGIRSGF